MGYLRFLKLLLILNDIFPTTALPRYEFQLHMVWFGHTTLTHVPARTHTTVSGEYNVKLKTACSVLA